MREKAVDQAFVLWQLGLETPRQFKYIKDMEIDY